MLLRIACSCACVSCSHVVDAHGTACADRQANLGVFVCLFVCRCAELPAAPQSVFRCFTTRMAGGPARLPGHAQAHARSRIRTHACKDGCIPLRQTRAPRLGCDRLERRCRATAGFGFWLWQALAFGFGFWVWRERRSSRCGDGVGRAMMRRRRSAERLYGTGRAGTAHFDGCDRRQR
jgi:hypothetical protein